ncbi:MULTISPECIES: MerR family transcriptional regulator [unclassified Asaia]|uniref:MerR family transcriptional regulator n=1 Tax=unclassified Asaia TaxID=2685023 RepID=UPI001F33B3D8|nr:MerR family transcriptional regulator [Asaia sp. W19]
MTTTHSAPDLLKGAEERSDLDRLVKGPNAYRTISEVADELHVPQHVLRFWETRFPEVKPLKRGGGRRYYSPEDIDTLRQITDLLYVQGYTIKGVQRVLKEHGAVGPLPVVASAPAEPELRQATGVDGGSAASETPRAPFEIPAFHPAVEEQSVDLDSGPMAADADEASIAEPGEGHRAFQNEGAVDAGEETNALPAEFTQVSIISPLANAEAEARGEAVVSAPSQGGSAAELNAILQDELAELRAKEERWRHERRALRLALEDVLGELDNLREMLPSA